MSTDLAQKCVLVVDDSKFVRTTFATILRPSFAVREAADGEAGWAAIEADPTIVLVLTGFTVIRRTIGGAGRAPGIVIGLWLLFRALHPHEQAHAARDGRVLALVTGLVPCPLTTFIMVYAAAQGITTAEAANRLAERRLADVGRIQLIRTSSRRGTP